MDGRVGSIRLTLWQQRIRDVRKHRNMRPLIDHIDRQAIARLHQRIQILPRGMHLDPAGMIVRRRRLEAIHERDLPRLRVFLVRPDLVGLQICRVQVCFRRVEHHPVDAGVRLVFVVLHVGGQRARFVDREDVPVPGVFVEWVAVDVEGGFVCGEDEDGARVGVGAGGEFWFD